MTSVAAESISSPSPRVAKHQGGDPVLSRSLSSTSTSCGSKPASCVHLETSGTERLFYGMRVDEVFPSAVLQLLLSSETRRFASYLTAYDLWHMRQVSRQFRRWSLSIENETRSLVRGMCWPTSCKEDVVALDESMMFQYITNQVSWAGLMVLYRGLTGLARRRRATTTIALGNEWSFVTDKTLSCWNNRLKFMYHHPGPERYYSDSWCPSHDLKNLLFLKRDPRSKLSAAEAIDSLTNSILDPSWTDVVVKREVVAASLLDPFPMFRQCVPYAAEPEIHIVVYLVRAALCWEPLRTRVFDVNSDLPPGRAIALFKSLAQRLTNGMEDEEDFDCLPEDEDDEWCLPRILAELRPFAHGVLALEPAAFWRNVMQPLPPLTDDLKRKYSLLAEAYLRRKHFQVTQVPWFDVPNLVMKGATINHQLYLLESAGDYMRRHELLAPFSPLPRSLRTGPVQSPYQDLVLHPSLRRPLLTHTADTEPAEEPDSESELGEDGCPNQVYVRVSFSRRNSQQDHHMGDICGLYVGPHGAYLCSCNDAAITARLAQVGILADDFMC
eukprot:Gregarina_sp_Pseudo_9__5621@NODE_776_length_2230_cov_30_548608_g731_i0_p1_GENE_NODE_776_length_2230_cov_30_548608_g731_i0NODE_776_length_2230_cov_30_548608_g731_i0_p1_ORF_typecomplete_len555_score128_92Fboxlike/PF12937_7/0_13Fboxlike/PF12937_7/4_8e03Fbox/PF00646_33/0_38Fbox/PF00646_33/8_4e03_NODE_776_length_2230_cov_30_548608_g731_i0331697